MYKKVSTWSVITNHKNKKYETPNFSQFRFFLQKMWKGYLKGKKKMKMESVEQLEILPKILDLIMRFTSK